MTTPATLSGEPNGFLSPGWNLFLKIGVRLGEPYQADMQHPTKLFEAIGPVFTWTPSLESSTPACLVFELSCKNRLFSITKSQIMRRLINIFSHREMYVQFWPK
jgi:hypothetical protein